MVRHGELDVLLIIRGLPRRQCRASCSGGPYDSFLPKLNFERAGTASGDCCMERPGHRVAALSQLALLQTNFEPYNPSLTAPS